MDKNYDQMIAEWIAKRLKYVGIPWHPKCTAWVSESRDGEDAAPAILACEVALRLQVLGSSFVVQGSTNDPAAKGAENDDDDENGDDENSKSKGKHG